MIFLMKKSYIPPVLEHYGPIANYTTGGSTKKTEWMQKSSSSSMGMGGGGGGWSQSMSKKKNVVKS